MKTKTNGLLGIALSIASTVALAGSPDPSATAMLQKLKGLYPATRFTSVGGTPINGVYEVVMGQNVAYVGGDGRHFLFGHLFDMRTQQDLTAAKLAQSDETPVEPRQVSFATLSLQVQRSSVSVLQGAGRRARQARQRHGLHLPAALAWSRIAPSRRGHLGRRHARPRERHDSP